MRETETIDLRNGASVAVFNAQEIEIYWPKVVELLEKLPHTWEGYTIESLHEQIQAGGLQLWGCGRDAIELVLITRLIALPKYRKVQLVWAGGTGLDDNLDAIDAAMDEFARINSCEFVEILDGRGGWTRKLKSRGFRVAHTILARPVSTRKMQ